MTANIIPLRPKKSRAQLEAELMAALIEWRVIFAELEAKCELLKAMKEEKK